MKTGDLAAYFDALAGAEPPGGAWIEFRYRREGGMGQRFFPAHRPAAAFEWIERTGQVTDLYVGCAPRRERNGTREAVERCHVLWIDADTPEAIAALERFEPAASIVVGSGSGRHAYWPLWPPLRPAHAERANRRLAHALGADPRACDAARILRPPGTLNHKTDPPQPVEVERLDVEVYTARQVVGELPDPPNRAPRRLPGRGGRVDRTVDPLLAIPPPVYVLAFTGRELDRDGKIACPLPGHEDHSPSFHVYADAERGWRCYGCERGGSIYDLARELSGIGDRGAEFVRLRDWIAARLLNAPLAAAA